MQHLLRTLALIASVGLAACGDKQPPTGSDGDAAKPNTSAATEGQPAAPAANPPAATSQPDPPPRADPPVEQARPEAPPRQGAAGIDPPIPADTEVQETASGLLYSVLRPGKGGRTPKVEDLVRLHYTGWLSGGKMFQSSRGRDGEPLEMPVHQFVPGWQEAVQMMTVGDRWKVTIPPELGYGKDGRPPTIPPNATLVFDMELLAIVSPEYIAPDPEKQKKTESGIFYEVIAAGAGQVAGPKDAVQFHFSLWNKEGQLLNWTGKSPKPLAATKDQLEIPFLKEALYMMKPGSRCRFEAPPQLVFGDRAMGERLPPNSPTVWEIELVAVAKVMPDPKYAPLDPEKTVKTRTGLRYEIIKEGDGSARPIMRQPVTVHYCGWLEKDGTRFDSSFGSGFPATFQLDRVIRGWTEGLKLMSPGAVFRFEIPPNLAYGRRGQAPSIPGNATLIFHVELIRIGE